MIKRERVLVAMSGGVDSSVAAAILKEEGYEVIGATMRLWPKDNCTKQKEKACCSLKDIEDARKVCDKLGIRHYVLNFEEVFRKEVIDYFTREYLSGRTPNPCIICNEKVKFGSLLKKAMELECSFVSTGHHARIERNAFCRLKEGIDKLKDQSYVLFSLTKPQLEKVLLPIGNLNKTTVKLEAKELGFNVYNKPESQEICFVPGNRYPDFIIEHCKVEKKCGDIIDTSGKRLGRHNGFWNFTIGQRKGLGIAHKEPLYVVDIKPKENIVIVGDFSEIKKKKFIVTDLNWIEERPVMPIEAEAKIRYSHKKAGAILSGLDNRSVEAEFLEEQEAITPGQAAVFYDGEYVLGGGWIDRVIG